MSAIILCIDDDPIRYQKLARRLAPDVMIVVTHQLQDVMFYLNNSDIYEMIGVCLDHDMPCAPNGLYYAQHIFNEFNIPVLITSMNPDGSAAIKAALDDYATPNKVLPISDDDSWALAAVLFFEMI